MYIELENPILKDTRIFRNVSSVTFHFSDRDEEYTTAEAITASDYTSLTVETGNRQIHFNRDYYITKVV